MGIEEDIRRKVEELQGVTAEENHTVTTPLMHAPKKKKMRPDLYMLSGGESSSEESDDEELSIDTDQVSSVLSSTYTAGFHGPNYSGTFSGETQVSLNTLAETAISTAPPTKKRALPKSKKVNIPLESENLPEDGGMELKPKRAPLSKAHMWDFMYNTVGGEIGCPKIPKTSPEFRCLKKFYLEHATEEDMKIADPKKRKYLFAKQQPMYLDVEAKFATYVKKCSDEDDAWAAEFKLSAEKIKAMRAEKKKNTTDAKARDKLEAERLALAIPGAPIQFTKMTGDANSTRAAFAYRNKLLEIDNETEAFNRTQNAKRQEAFTLYNNEISK